MAKLISLVFFVGLTVVSLFAAELPVLNAENGFGMITSVSKASAKVTNGVLSITDISRDHEIYFKVSPFFAAEVDAIDIRYRASGQEIKVGGQIYYAPGIDSYVGGRCWKVPPVVSDGKWHTIHLAEENLPNPEEWRRCGILDRFRLDITDSPGGKIEIAEIAFRRKQPSATALEKGGNPDLGFIKALDGDLWPAVVPETLAGSPTDTGHVVSVGCKGGTVCPQKAKAGELVRLSFDFVGDAPDFPVRMNVSLLKGTSLCWTEELWLGHDAFRRIGGKVWSLEFQYRLPICIDSGRLTIRADSPTIQCVFGEIPSVALDFERIRVIPGWENPVSADVRKIAGSPQFFVNGHPFYALSGWVARPRRHSRAPLNLVTVGRSVNWWVRGKEIDTSMFDIDAERCVRTYPSAFFMWNLSVFPPNDWRESNPNDMAMDDRGRVSVDGEVNYSFASKRAFDDMGDMVEKAIRYLESSPYANRIVGYRINSGRTTEWLGWRARKGAALDFSPVAEKGFSEHLRRFYPEVDNVSVPSLAERCQLDAPMSGVWDLDRHLRTSAYYDFYSRLVSDGVLRMCRRAKDILRGRKLVGTYFGYSMIGMEFGDIQMTGHLATKRLLDGASGAIDFLMSPQGYCYGQRGLGDPLVDMKPFASFRDHGIVSMIEDDTRTHNIRPQGPGLQTRTESQTTGVMRRNMGISICRNQPFYTYAICDGSEFDFPQFASDAARLRRVGEHALAVGARRNAEIAVVVSEEAMKAMPIMSGVQHETFANGEQNYRPDGQVDRRITTSGPPLVRDAYAKLYTRLSRVGAAVDYRLAEDMADNPGDYRLYVFSVCLRSVPSLVRAAKLLRNRNCTIVWTYAPGFVSRGGNSIARMKELTGIDFALSKRQDAAITLSNGAQTGATGHDVVPLFKVVSPCEKLGTYANGDVAFAVVNTGKASSVFFGSYRLELPVLRMIAQRAGVHIYTESTDPVEANDRFFTLHARFAGKKTVSLPRRTSIYDVFNDRMVATDVDSFSFDAPLHSSWLFYCADDAESLHGR